MHRSAFPLHQVFRPSSTKHLLKEWDYNYFDNVLLCKFSALEYLSFSWHWYHILKEKAAISHSTAHVGMKRQQMKKTCYVLFLIFLILPHFCLSLSKSTILHYILPSGFKPTKKLKIHTNIKGGHLHLPSQPTKKTKKWQSTTRLILN